MKSYIPLETAAIFLKRTFFQNRVLPRSMLRLILFARAARSENRKLQNEKLLPIPGLELTTPDSQI